MKTPPRFRLRGSGELKLYTFDDEVAAFNPVTWDTHLLDASAVVVLKALARAPATSTAIEQFLSGSCTAAEAEAAPLTTALLDQLASAGLIETEPIDPPR